MTIDDDDLVQAAKSGEIMLLPVSRLMPFCRSVLWMPQDVMR